MKRALFLLCLFFCPRSSAGAAVIWAGPSEAMRELCRGCTSHLCTSCTSLDGGPPVCTAIYCPDPAGQTSAEACTPDHVLSLLKRQADEVEKTLKECGH